jgi:RHS repeat-associated protein
VDSVGRQAAGVTRTSTKENRTTLLGCPRAAVGTGSPDIKQEATMTFTFGSSETAFTRGAHALNAAKGEATMSASVSHRSCGNPVGGRALSFLRDGLVAVCLLAGGVGTAMAQSQSCPNPTYTDQSYPYTAGSTPDIGETVLMGYCHSPDTFNSGSCTIGSGSEVMCNALYNCTATCYCAGPPNDPNCNVAGTTNLATTVDESGTPYKYFITLAPQPAGNQETKDPVGHPINPAAGTVYDSDSDFVLPGGLSWTRYYDSGTVNKPNLGVNWSSSYTRGLVMQMFYPPCQGCNESSPLYYTPAQACTLGLPAAYGNSQDPAYAGATGTFDGTNCNVSGARNGANGVLPIYSYPPQPASPTLIEVDAYRDDGQMIRFPVVAGTLTPPSGVSVRLVATQNGYTLTDDDDNVETYNASGLLLSITTRAGVVQTVAYDASSRLSTITDSFGHSLVLTYNASNTVATVTADGGAVVQYAYDTSGRLSVVTNADTTTKTYVYENASFTTALTGVIDESSTRYLTWGYNATGQATSQQFAGGANLVTVTYPSIDTAAVTDALGAVRTFNFTRVGDRLGSTGITGSQCPTCEDGAGTNYDPAGWVASRTDYIGNETCYANDPTRGLELVRVEGFAPGSTCPSNLASYTPASGTRQRKITTSWHASFRVPVTITEFNRTTSFTYDPSGNMLTRTVTDTTVTPNVGRTWTFTYDGYGRVLTAKLPRTDVNSTTTYVYYTCTTGIQCGHVNTATNAAGQVTTFNTYNAYGLPLTITDPNGVVTTLGYDARQRVTSRQVGTETTTFSYWPTGKLKQVTLPDTSSIQYTYDGAHRLTQITDGTGNKITYTLDALGNRTAESAYDPSSVLARTHTRVFNTLSQLYQDIGAANTSAVTTTYGYDANGNPVTINAPLSRNTSNTFDELNRLTQVTDPASGITKFQYDAGYQYNGFGQVAQLTSPDTGVTATTYDSGGNVATSTDARGAISTYAYDTLNRVTSAAFKLGGTTDQTITYTYDAGTNGKGRLTGASDANHSMTWGYDALGRVNSKKQTQGAVNQTVGYTYTNADLTTLTTPSGQTVTYTYSNGVVASIAINGTTLLSSVAYEPFGPVRGWTWGNSTSEVRLYNTDGNPSQYSAIESTTLAYDNAFRISGTTNASNSALSWTYGYDLLDRLTSAAATGTTRGWTFDANGNRLTQTGTVAGTYTPSSSSNRLSSITGTPARTYSYDSAGNTLTYSTTTFTYYNRGRMRTAKVGSSTTTYYFNVLGERIKKTGGSAGTVLMVYDEAGHLLGEYSSTGALVQETVWLGDTPVATIRPNGSSVSVYYVHADHRNAPQMVTRPSDNKLTWRWDTDPYGTTAPNQNPQSLGTFVYNLRYPGQYYDSETGLFYNYFRDYDPQTGRYVESDPIGLLGGINTYGYSTQNPISNVDLTGQATLTIPFPDIPIPGWLSIPAARVLGGLGLLLSLSGDTPQCDKNKEKHCRGLYDTIIRSCWSISDPRKKQRCFEAAKSTYEQCMAE